LRRTTRPARPNRRIEHLEVAPLTAASKHNQQPLLAEKR